MSNLCFAVVFAKLGASKNAGAVHNQSVQLRASVAAFFRRMRTDIISFRLTGKWDAETRPFLTGRVRVLEVILKITYLDSQTRDTDSF